MQIKNKKWKNIFLLSFIGFFLIFSFEIIPRLSNIGVLTYKWMSHKILSDSDEKVVQKVKEITIRNSELKSKIGFIVSDYKKNKNISDVISLLDTIASRCNCHITDIKPRRIVKKDNLWTQPVELSLISDYEGFYNYLLMLEHSSKVVIMKQLLIVPNKQYSDTLNIKTSIEIYLNI